MREADSAVEMPVDTGLVNVMSYLVIFFSTLFLTACFGGVIAASTGPPWALAKTLNWLALGCTAAATWWVRVRTNAQYRLESGQLVLEQHCLGFRSREVVADVRDLRAFGWSSYRQKVKGSVTWNKALFFVTRKAELIRVSLWGAAPGYNPEELAERLQIRWIPLKLGAEERALGAHKNGNDVDLVHFNGSHQIHSGLPLAAILIVGMLVMIKCFL